MVGGTAEKKVLKLAYQRNLVAPKRRSDFQPLHEEPTTECTYLDRAKAWSNERRMPKRTVVAGRSSQARRGRSIIWERTNKPRPL